MDLWRSTELFLSVFVSLDIFRNHIQNEGIRTKPDAWQTFLTSDNPETILLLTERVSEFGDAG